MAMVDRFTSIIDAFEDTTVGLSLDQVAARARLPRSTTHRILDHLVRLNWLSRSENGYGLGARAVAWGAGDAADLRLRAAAAPVLHDLHTTTGAVVHLGVLDGEQVVHLDKLGGRCAQQVPTRVGSRCPARRLALGLAVLAARPIGDGEFSAELYRIRRSGVLHRCGDYRPGLVSVAATVDARSALGIVLPAKVAVERYKPLMVAAAARVRDALS